MVGVVARRGWSSRSGVGLGSVGLVAVVVGCLVIDKICLVVVVLVSSLSGKSSSYLSISIARSSLFEHCLR